MTTKMSDEIYIPPPGVLFRLLGLRTQTVLVARVNTLKLGNHPVDGDVYPDSKFTLEDVPGKQGRYFIRSVRGGNNPVLYSRQRGKPYAGQTERNNDFHDQQFEFQPGASLFNGYFRLFTPSMNRVIISNKSPKGDVSNFDADGGLYDDQYFSFILEGTTLDHVEYDIDQGKVTYMAPSIYDSTVVNEGSEEAKQIADTTHTVTQQTSFTHHTGYEFSIGEKASFGVPTIAGGEVSSEQRWVSDYEWGSTKTESLELGGGVEVAVPPFSRRTVTSETKHGRMDVPATIYSKTESGQMVTTKAIYEATDYWNHVHTIHEAEPIGKSI